MDEALRLEPDEREALAGELFDSLETNDPDAEAAWDAEIERRTAELDEGKVKCGTIRIREEEIAMTHDRIVIDPQVMFGKPVMKKSCSLRAPNYEIPR